MRSSSRRHSPTPAGELHHVPAVSHPDRRLDLGAGLRRLNETDGTITFDSNPGFTDGEALTYHAVPGQRIGGLTDGTTYYAIVNSASPDTLQLAATAPVDGVDGPAIPLNLDPEFQGFRQSLPVTVNPGGGLPPTRSSSASTPGSSSATASSTRGRGSAA